MYKEVTSGTGLIGRWGLNDNTGTTANNSIAGRPNGTLTNGPAWVTGFPMPDTTPPTAPTGLSATSGSTIINLTWTANIESDLNGYNVYRYVAPSTYAKVNASLITGTSYAVTGLTNGTPYTYVVTAVNRTYNESGYSSSASATPAVDTIPPAAPTGLTATGGNKLVNLTWTANGESDLAGYNLYRSTTLGGPYTKVNTPLITGISYTDSNLTNGTPYYYVLPRSGYIEQRVGEFERSHRNAR